MSAPAELSAPAEQSRFGYVMLGTIALLSGAALPIHLLFLSGAPATTAHDLLAVYEKNQSTWAPIFYSQFGFLTVAIPTIAAFGHWLSPRSGALAWGGAFVAAAGALIIGFGSGLATGALIALSNSPSDAVFQPTATFLAAFWDNMRDVTDMFGYALFGLGLLMLGRVAWRSHIAPDWLAIVGMIGGLAGLVASATGRLGVFCLLAFAIWSFAFGAIVFSKKTASPA